MTEIERAREALRRWARRTGPIAGLERAHEHPIHEQATVFGVMTAHGEAFILKNVVGAPNAGRIESEYSLLRHLEARGVPVAVPIPSDGGALAVEEGPGLYLLYPRLPVGGEGPADVGQVYGRIGAALARLHRALAAYGGQVDSWTMDLPRAVFEEAVPRVLCGGALSDREAEAFQGVMVGLRDEMTAALRDLPLQLIHGDCHGGNILLYRGEVSGFVDLDHLPTGPRVYDLGYLLADMAKAPLVGNPAHRRWLAQFHHLIAGYEQESRLSRREKDALWFIMLATQVLFVDWFLQHGRDELARRNLAAFHWIDAQEDEIRRRIASM